MTPPRVITSPYHDGREGVDRGRGPAVLLQTASAELANAPVDTVPPVDPVLPEAARVFELARRLAQSVHAARTDGAFPLVLAGDCNSCLGTLAGCGTNDLAVLWCDAHPDFDTPQRSTSGSLDAMGLALATGHGWDTLRQQIPGLTPIRESNVVLVGVRDFEPGQRTHLQRSRIHVLEGNAFTNEDLRAALDDLRRRAGRLYLHIDLDSLDPREGTANQYSAAGGLSITQLLATIADAFTRFHVAGAALTAYNPDTDTDRQMASTATRVLATLAEHAHRQSQQHPDVR